MKRGTAVRVRSGRWAGRVGTLVGYHVNPGSRGGQQRQEYPVVHLYADGRKRARTVRVLAVERLDDEGLVAGGGA